MQVSLTVTQLVRLMDHAVSRRRLNLDTRFCGGLMSLRKVFLLSPYIRFLLAVSFY